MSESMGATGLKSLAQVTRFSVTKRTIEYDSQARKSVVCHRGHISQIPDFSKYSPTKSISELAPYVSPTLCAYPLQSKYVNQQHYYQNKDILEKHYLTKKPHPVSLSQLAQYFDDSNTLTKQKIVNSSRFVQQELVTRIAHKIHLLQTLPFNVVNNFHFSQVYESYYNIFERFRRYPTVKTIADNDKFARFLQSILSDFNSLNLPHLIMGALECRILDLYPPQKMDEVISSLLRARISRRLIVEEHLSITANYQSGKKENTLVLGDIFQECSAREFLLGAKAMCEKFIQDMYFQGIKLPEFVIDGNLELKFYFLPLHLKYLLGEVLRNSYEATMKEYIRLGLKNPEPITVTIVSNDQSFMFRISDRAGGIPHDEKTIWSFGKSKQLASESLNNFHKLPGLQTISLYDYMYDRDGGKPTSHPYKFTSLEPVSASNLPHGHKFEKPLLGLLERSSRYKLGIGLAMCKVYAEYWNGDLTVHSINGYGTDTVLKLGNLMYHTDKLQLDKV
ncbi:LAME_0C06986g1_1 [Lachancea meyersii CBS 8951]|uniref:Protein-serine/threonine kinase n=1 Tax=Lachancea meyersii CBS 8951 TaxID=1266667 RepID=A0A1G4J365_9SACH|nr:LAME_0C06986g1_1 [Lachancea meyersii CBS 8951]